MSLDVYLTLKDNESLPAEPRIFIREDGQTKQLTRSEWDERFPGREPATVETESGEVYSANITHNLNRMADAAGLYKPLWRPEALGLSKASQLIEPLRLGLELLKSDPGRFQTFNPKNGWGNYANLVRFVEDYLSACEAHPDAEVSVSR